MNDIQELIQQVESGGTVKESELAALLSSQQAAVRSLGYQLKSQNHLNTGMQKAQEAMGMACQVEGYANTTLLMNVLRICHKRNDGDATFRHLLRGAQSAVRRGDDALGLELLLQACHVDINELDIRHCAEHASIRTMVDLYATMAEHVRARLTFSEPRAPIPRRPIRVAHVVPNLMDGTNSPTKLVRNFIKHADRDQFDLRLYSTEVLSKHQRVHFPMAMQTPGSRRRAPETLAYLAEHNVPVFLAPTDGDLLDGALALARQMYRDRMDVALYHSSLATSIDCLVAHLQPTPMCVNVCIGVPMYARTADAGVFFVRGNWERERPFWEAQGQEAHFVLGGIDLDDVFAAEPLDRRRLAPNPDTVLMGTVGNHLTVRMSDAFCRLVARLMQRHPNLCYMIVGIGDFTKQKAIWKEAGVQERVVLVGGRADAVRFTKTIDLYLNEFPEGGGMSVCEAMAAGKPVVALKAGNQHLQCCGVEYVGDEFGIMDNDPSAYEALAGRLITDATYRRQVGAKMQERYHTVYAGHHLVRRTEAIVLDLFNRRAGTSPSAARAG